MRSTPPKQRDSISRKATRDRLQKQLKLDIVISYSKICIAGLTAPIPKGFTDKGIIVHVQTSMHTHFLPKKYIKQVPWGRWLKTFGHSLGMHSFPMLWVSSAGLPNSEQQIPFTPSITERSTEFSKFLLLRWLPAASASCSCRLVRTSFPDCGFHIAVQPLVMNPAPGENCHIN